MPGPRTGWGCGWGAFLGSPGIEVAVGAPGGVRGGGGSRAVINAPERLVWSRKQWSGNTTKNLARSVEGGQLELRSVPEVLVER